MSIIYLAGGCFWGVEKYVAKIPGVLKTQVGYANGRTASPSYEEVCGGSGHAEAVLVEYDSQRLELSRLLELFFDVIDPTSVNRQGGDAGEQYRTGIYYADAADEETVKAALGKLRGKYDAPIAVESKPLENYYPAEDYHQKYLDKNPNGYCHIGADKFCRVD